MGLEASCRAHWNGESSDGTAHLESDHLLFRGTFRLKFLFRDTKAVHSDNGSLVLETEQGRAVFELGERGAAPKWAKKIASPPSLLEKLVIKPETRISLLGDFEDQFVSTLNRKSVAPARAEVVLLAADSTGELAALQKLADGLAPTAALWIVYPKGRKDIRESDVLAAGRAVGLKDLKVASFSPTHTALKFVVPVAKRR